MGKPCCSLRPAGHDCIVTGGAATNGNRLHRYPWYSVAPDVARCPAPDSGAGERGLEESRLPDAGYLGGGFSIVKASGRIPFSTLRQLTGAAIGDPARARGDQAPMAVVPRPFRR